MIEHRPYADGDQSGVDMFIGDEVEHSPAHGLRTLFVVGQPNVTSIEQALSNSTSDGNQPVEHVYFGANMSCTLANNDPDGWKIWEDAINHFMDQGYLCTLDIGTHQLPGLLDGGLCENSRFIPMISVKLPYTRLLNYNTTVKIDDIGFDRTNPGVWCWGLHDLLDRDRFTPWQKYTKDQPVR